jgi:WXG100 family type VII secretion target
MTEQQWDFQRIEQQSAELDQEADAVRASLEQEKAMLPAVAACWGGDGSEAWAAQRTRWLQKADDVASTLKKLCDAVHESVQIQKDAEGGITDMFR